MGQGFFSKSKADGIGNGLFLIGIGILFYTNAWWPGILPVIWVSVGFRQLATGKYYDLVLSTVILLGLFWISLYNITLSIIIPVLFVVGGIYIIFKEYFFPYDTNGEDKAEEIKHDIEDGK